MISLDSLLTMRPRSAVPEHGHRHVAVEVVVADDVGLAQEREVVDRVGRRAARVGDRPAALVALGVDDRHRDRVLEALEVPVDDRAVRPRARGRDVEVVAPGLGLVAGAAVGGDEVAEARIPAPERAVVALFGGQRLAGVGGCHTQVNGIRGAGHSAAAHGGGPCNVGPPWRLGVTPRATRERRRGRPAGCPARRRRARLRAPRGSPPRRARARRASVRADPGDRRGRRPGSLARPAARPRLVRGPLVAAHLPLPHRDEPRPHPRRARGALGAVLVARARRRGRAVRGARALHLVARARRGPLGVADPPVERQRRADRALGRGGRRRSTRRSSELPETQRRVVTLRDVEGFGADEVCDLLGLSEGNQRVLLHRARTKLRQALAEYYA